MFAVEARIFDNGNIYAFVRPSYDGETDSYIEDVYCDIYITIFDDRIDVHNYCNDYQNA